MSHRTERSPDLDDHWDREPVRANMTVSDTVEAFLIGACSATNISGNRGSTVLLYNKGVEEVRQCQKPFNVRYTSTPEFFDKVHTIMLEREEAGVRAARRFSVARAGSWSALMVVVTLMAVGIFCTPVLFLAGVTYMLLMEGSFMFDHKAKVKYPGGRLSD